MSDCTELNPCSDCRRDREARGDNHSTPSDLETDRLRAENARLTEDVASKARIIAMLDIEINGAMDDYARVKAEVATLRAALAEATREMERQRTDFSVNKDAWRQHYERAAERLAAETEVQRRNWFK